MKLLIYLNFLMLKLTPSIKTENCDRTLQSPLVTNRLTTCEPINPAPPVIKIFFINILNSSFFFSKVVELKEKYS